MNPQICSLFESCCAVEGTGPGGPGGPGDEVFKKLPAVRGLVLFADSAGEPVQLLCAADIRRTARARFTAEAADVPSRRKISIAEVTAYIYYLSCFCDFRTSLKYYEIAKSLFPEGYSDLLAFGKCSYLKIDTGTAWPSFSITDRPVIGINKKVLGPFPSRKWAAGFLCALEDAFLLCRRPLLLSKTEKAKSCPYFQMQLCRHSCAGQSNRDQYIEHITAAISAIENIDEESRTLKDQMRLFSEKLDFEKAQIAKKQLDALNLLRGKKYRWVSVLDSLAVLHIDKGAKIKISGQRRKNQTYAAFLIRADGIIELGDFRIDQSEALYNSLKEKLSALPRAFDAEELSIAAYYFYRNNPPGLWLRCKDINSAEEIGKRIRQEFSVP